MIHLVYSKRESTYTWLVITVLCIVTFVAGAYFVPYYPWVLLPVLLLSITKLFKSSKKRETPVIQLDEVGLTTLSTKGNKLYPYTDITTIHMDSNLLNGYIKILGQPKKIHLDTVAIAIDKQHEIVEIVCSKIPQNP